MRGNKIGATEVLRVITPNGKEISVVGASIDLAEDILSYGEFGTMQIPRYVRQRIESIAPLMVGEKNELVLEVIASSAEDYYNVKRNKAKEPVLWLAVGDDKYEPVKYLPVNETNGIDVIKKRQVSRKKEDGQQLSENEVISTLGEVIARLQEIKELNRTNKEDVLKEVAYLENMIDRNHTKVMVGITIVAIMVLASTVSILLF